MPSYTFTGINFNAFTDISYLANKGNHSVVAGANFIHDKFREKETTAARRDNKNRTAGAYAQYTWDASEKIKLESGLRIDNAWYGNMLYSKNETFVLPRMSLLIKYNPKWSSRIGGGMGIKRQPFLLKKPKRYNTETLNS